MWTAGYRITPRKSSKSICQVVGGNDERKVPIALAYAGLTSCATTYDRIKLDAAATDESNTDLCRSRGRQSGVISDVSTIQNSFGLHRLLCTA